MSKTHITIQTKKDKKTNLYSYTIRDEDKEIIARSAPKYESKEAALSTIVNALKKSDTAVEPPKREQKRAKK